VLAIAQKGAVFRLESLIKSSVQQYGGTRRSSNHLFFKKWILPVIDDASKWFFIANGNIIPFSLSS
jgi:hypothetical protein